MGDGGGSSGPFKIGGLSGQGGGRILPGSGGGIGELILSTPRVDIDQQVVPGAPDRRPSPPFGSPFDTIFAAPGGGPGQPGKGDTFTIYVRDAGGGNDNPERPFAGGGGGWGAAGGAGTQTLDDLTVQQGGNPGAAGGKAIKTNGHAVTWLGGSDRAYGAIG
ncbi:hypothetical protein [Salibaculum griseiflavum]|uniref:hypothetical protein n=1 Tax=Salibaculum griseiflavum TaxID=1914409 RepID=UPI000D698679|nr:hypothetical protein [Salibaculum griseiflavum]